MSIKWAWHIQNGESAGLLKDAFVNMQQRYQILFYSSETSTRNSRIKEHVQWTAIPAADKEELAIKIMRRINKYCIN